MNISGEDITDDEHTRVNGRITITKVGVEEDKESDAHGGMVPK